MSNSLLYSESYLYKVINKLKIILHELDFGIKIISARQGRKKIVGDESRIRILHYMLLNSTFLKNWPLSRVKEEDVLGIQSFINSKRYSRLTPVGKKKLNLIIGIYENAQRCNHFLPQIDKEITKLAEISSNESESNIYLKHLERGVKKNNELNYEAIHLSFVVNYFIQNLRSELEKEKIGNMMSKVHSNEIVFICKKILKELKKEFYLSLKVYNILLYNLVNTLVMVEHFGLHLFYEEPDKDSKNYYSELHQYVIRIVENIIIEKKNFSYYEYLKEKFTEVISGYLLFEEAKVLKIYIEFFYHPGHKQIVENTIIHTYSTKMVKVTEDFIEADIIISDTQFENNKKQFYFENIHNEESWKKLSVFFYEAIERNILNFNKSSSNN